MLSKMCVSVPSCVVEGVLLESHIPEGSPRTLTCVTGLHLAILAWEGVCTTVRCGPCGILFEINDSMPRKVVTKPYEVERSGRSYGVISFVVIGLLMVVGTIVWARSDAGMIDVSATIANSQANRNSEAGVDDNTLPPQAPPEYASKPNGGLQAQGGEVSRPPEPEPVLGENSSSTATTTESGTEEGEGTDPSKSTPSEADETPEISADSTETPADTEPLSSSAGEGANGGEGQ